MSNDKIYAFLKFSNKFQLYSALAYLEKEASTGNKNVTLIATHKAYWETQYNFDLEALAFENLKLVPIQELIEIKKSQKKRPHYTFTVNEGHQQPWSNSKNIIIDDGIGAYRDNITDLIKTIINERKITKSGILRTAKSIIYILIKKTLSFTFRSERFGLLLSKNNVQKNPEFTDNLKKVIVKINTKKNGIHPTKESDITIFLSQPAVALGWFTREQYAQIIEFTRHWAEASQNTRLLIKRHPADNYAYEDFTLIETQETAEEIFHRMKPKSVISISSTASLTAQLVFGIPSFIIDINNTTLNKNKFIKNIFFTHTTSLNINDQSK